VKNRIYGNWQQWTIDAPARASRTMHCAITFTINRDGSLKDARISESSGNTSYDNSALRAVLSSTPVTKLPGDYSGAYVVATLDFNPPSIR
jgi:TonB family protein